jgi:Fe-S cluster assembly scaffold protein SufB
MSRQIWIDGSKPTVHIDCAPNEQVEAVILLKDQAAVSCTATLQAHSQIKWHSVVMGEQVQCEVFTDHQGEGSSSEHIGVFVGRDHHQFKLNYHSNHQAAHTSGHITVHGVLFDAAYADFKGNIVIAQTGQDTSASLNEHTLLLGDKARSDSIPQMDIQTDTVKATHSSGMSRIDQEQLFYCTSRGISKEAASQLIVHGFLAECIQLPQLQAAVDEYLQYAEA